MAGKLVKTTRGTGYTNNNDKPINGKIFVYLDDGGKIICSPDKIEFLGFWDGRGRQYETKKP